MTLFDILRTLTHVRFAKRSVTMFYPKNVPNWERIIRVISGMLLITLSIVSLTSGTTPVLGLAGIVSAFFLVITGFIGWCPACAMIGRKIKQEQNRS